MKKLLASFMIFLILGCHPKPVPQRSIPPLEFNLKFTVQTLHHTFVVGFGNDSNLQVHPLTDSCPNKCLKIGEPFFEDCGYLYIFDPAEHLFTLANDEIPSLPLTPIYSHHWSPECPNCEKVGVDLRDLRD